MASGRSRLDAVGMSMSYHQIFPRLNWLNYSVECQIDPILFLTGGYRVSISGAGRRPSRFRVQPIVPIAGMKATRRASALGKKMMTGRLAQRGKAPVVMEN